MVNWVGFVEDTRGRKAFIIDDRFPKAKQIDPESPETLVVRWLYSLYQNYTSH